MSYDALLVWTVVLFALAVYAQHQVPRFTRPDRVWFLRAVLGLLGVAVGVSLARAQGMLPNAANPVLAFLFGFGLVHVPAAAILALKRLRGSGRT